MKKWMAAILAAVMLTGAFSGAHAEGETERMNLLEGEVILQEWEETRLLCSVEWETLMLDEASSAVYPALAAALEKISGERDAAAESEMELLLPMAKEIDGDAHCSSSSEYFVRRADGSILSVLQHVYTYSGGAHPNYGMVGLNLRPATGEELEMRDVLADPDAAVELIARKLQEKYPAEYSEDWSALLEAMGADEFEWTMDDQGMTFYFSPGMITPYAAGLLTAVIRFDEAPELFAEEFVQTERRARAIEIPMYMEIEFDRNTGDGESDRLIVDPVMDEYGAYPGLNVTLNGASIYEDCYYAYDMRAWLVTAYDGEQRRSFLYVESLSDNDYLSIYVYDLNGEAPVRAAVLDGTGFGRHWSEEEKRLYTEVFTDAQEFELNTRLFVLGTLNGTKVYEADPADGAPRSADEAYEYREYQMELTSKQPLEAVVTTSGEKETFPAGTRFTLIRTDNKSYVDFRTEDGRECRMELDASEHPLKINGIPEEDCFDGLLYAG